MPSLPSIDGGGYGELIVGEKGEILFLFFSDNKKKFLIH